MSIKLNKDLFNKTLKLVGLRFPSSITQSLIKKFHGYTFSRLHFKCVVDDSVNNNNGEAKPTHKILLLDEKFNNESLPQPLLDFLQILHEDIQFVQHEVNLDFSHFTTEQVLRQYIPPEIEQIPSSFETIGHIAHLNLKDELLPYKGVIGEVLLAKNPSLKTVVNKTGLIETEFRTFPMEVIAGVDSLDTEVKESGCIFRFNFAEVYWNSRLQMEHDRVIQMILKGSTVADVFAGIGPFAIPLAKKGCVVFANDLNPRSFHYLKENAAANKVQKNINCYNKDGREFIHFISKANQPIASSSSSSSKSQPGLLPVIQHYIMNLPALAVSFLDVFRELNLKHRPVIHCYGFTDAPDLHADILAQITQVLGKAPLNPQVYEVRDVSPKKRMMCVSFNLPDDLTPLSSSGNNDNSNNNNNNNNSENSDDTSKRKIDGSESSDSSNQEKKQKS
eukprot:TRINITY_DN1439_c0_g2_i2.p1 TRINITY_DN1439_c0_g2~~TRINITY_DN1439_c0_g2_i2.p1  ORF type:complete len:448 (+),score=85.48 TRINITY_DN1439_c0_g2_i2:87-1430(+)